LALTFDEIKRIVFSFQKARDANVQESTIEAAINSAINRTIRGAELPPLRWEPPSFPTVASDASYDMHDQVFKVLSVEIEDAGVRSGLDFRAWDQMRELRFGTQANGKPEFWTVWEGKMELWPTPDKVYTIYYPSLRKAGGLDAIDDQFRDVVINGALAFFDPAYIPVFEKGKKEVNAYWEYERAERMSFEMDAAVEAHFDFQDRINVV
jgi:hypothetical protein